MTDSPVFLLGAFLVLLGLAGNRLRWTWPGLSNTRLVRFKNGKWGVRYGWVWHSWRDFRHTQFTWSSGDPYFNDCQTSSESEARSYVSSKSYVVQE